jgi:hypothetical protein
MMPTGIAFTTVLSSLHCMAMYMWFFHEQARTNDKVDIEKAAQEIGFNIKFKTTHDYSQLTFLRGWFNRSTQEWAPLPSCVLKLGKVLRDPRKIFPAHPRPIDMIARCVANAYKGLPDDYPIVGPFLQTLRKCAPEHKDGSHNEALIESWAYKVHFTQEDLDIPRVDVLDQIVGRYGLTVADIESAEELIRTVRRLPALLVHPVFVTLLAMDYA